MNQDLKRKSKKIALALRHSPEKFNLSLDNEGWCDLDTFISNVNITRNEINEILKSCDKNRYSLNDKKTKIRANQGHSVNINISYKRITDIPERLFHGTKKDYLKSIIKQGLLPGKRTHVHLSGDLETAHKVASRRKGDSVIIEILPGNFKTEELLISENGVYLTKMVNPKYIRIYNPFNEE